MAMISRERVLAALRREVPDRVPYCELGVDRSLAARLMGWGEPASQAANLEANAYSAEEAKSVAARLGADNICFVLRAPVFADKVAGLEGRLFYGNGQIRSEADLGRLELPDPTRDELYAEAERFVAQKGDYACWFVTRLGIFPTMLSMGTESFAVSLHENLGFVEAVLDAYCDWAGVVAERVCQMGFDVYVSTDDMAFKTAPFFSPTVFRDLVVPRYRRVAERISLPWVTHSDGNVAPFLDDLVALGIAGMHPIEKGAMDIAEIKRQYGGRICLLGNVDLNILGMGTPEDVEAEVRYLISVAGPGGGYIATSGNSLAGYVKPENALALGAAVAKHGRYPL